MGQKINPHGFRLGITTDHVLVGGLVEGQFPQAPDHVPLLDARDAARAGPGRARV